MLQNVLMMFTNVSLNIFLTHLFQKSISKRGLKHNTPKTSFRELCLVLKVQESLAPCGAFMEQYRICIYIYISHPASCGTDHETIQKGIELPGNKSWN